MEQPNFSYIDALSSGDIAFKQELIRVLKEEFPLEKSLYELQLENQNYEENSLLVHKIKHKISILGMQQSYALAQKHEMALKKQQENYVEMFSDVLQRIEDFLNDI